MFAGLILANSSHKRCWRKLFQCVYSLGAFSMHLLIVGVCVYLCGIVFSSVLFYMQNLGLGGVAVSRFFALYDEHHHEHDELLCVVMRNTRGFRARDASGRKCISTTLSRREAKRCHNDTASYPMLGIIQW